MGRNCKTPGVTFAHGSVGLNFIDPPIISGSGHQTFRIRKISNTNHKICVGLIAKEGCFSPAIYVINIFTEVHIM